VLVIPSRDHELSNSFARLPDIELAFHRAALSFISRHPDRGIGFQPMNYR